MRKPMDAKDAAARVNVNLLPPNLRVLCRAMGPAKAFELCKVRGGVPMLVPKRARLDHWLVPIIGFDGLQALVAELGNVWFDVPKYDKVAKQLHHQAVHACLKAGMGLTRTALETGYSKRHVLNLQHDLAIAEGERYLAPGLAGEQGDMFAELLVPASPHELDDEQFEEMEARAVAEQDATSGLEGV